MAFKIHDQPDQAYILVLMSGRLDDEELLVYQDSIYKTPGFKTKHQLVDYGGVTDFAISSDGIRLYTHIGMEREEVKTARPDRKVAFVSPGDVEFGMGRVFMAYAHQLPTNYGVFRTRDEAVIWLGS